ncbi:uncharacterized protein [Euphorbia lathyris]|uniref:uncharacterized protein n=1 Tax=Euphorbia lathyris TaxID=212925 RepID=UPI003313280B
MSMLLSSSSARLLLGSPFLQFFGIIFPLHTLTSPSSCDDKWHVLYQKVKNVTRRCCFLVASKNGLYSVKSLYFPAEQIRRCEECSGRDSSVNGNDELWKIIWKRSKCERCLLSFCFKFKFSDK